MGLNGAQEKSHGGDERSNHQPDAKTSGSIRQIGKLSFNECLCYSQILQFTIFIHLKEKNNNNNNPELANPFWAPDITLKPNPKRIPPSFGIRFRKFS